MNHQFNSDEDVMAQLLREAGDPSATPDREYEANLRAAILERTESTETTATDKAALAQPKANSTGVRKGEHWRRLAALAVVAVVLLALGLFVRSYSGGGASNLAFAQVVEAHDNLRTATYDCTMQMTNPADGMTTTTKLKGFFLAPSYERAEMTISVAGMKGGPTIMIMDHQSRKGLTLVPDQKMATTIDLTNTTPPNASNPFELMRQLMQNGAAAEGVESLGRQEIDGYMAIGFRIKNNMMDQTFWADSQTARLVRVDINSAHNGAAKGVMTNFRYDAKLDPSLFSLEAPKGYRVNAVNVRMPTEDDLINELRLVAEHHDDVFPPEIGMGNKEYQQAIHAAVMAETEKFLQEPATLELREKLKAEYGDDSAGFTKAWMKAMLPRNQELTLKYSRGSLFYNLLTSANDSHYAGQDVKLGAPDRPILWYRPTGSENYRVIYADLSVQEIDAEGIKHFPEPKEE